MQALGWVCRICYTRNVKKMCSDGLGSFVLFCFLLCVQNRIPESYNHVPFHCFQHAVMVTQMVGVDYYFSVLFCFVVLVSVRAFVLCALAVMHVCFHIPHLSLVQPSEICCVTVWGIMSRMFIVVADRLRPGTGVCAGYILKTRKKKKQKLAGHGLLCS